MPIAYLSQSPFHPFPEPLMNKAIAGERGEPEEYTVVETRMGRLTNSHECSPERVKVNEITMLVILRYKH